MKNTNENSILKLIHGIIEHHTNKSLMELTGDELGEALFHIEHELNGSEVLSLIEAEDSFKFRKKLNKATQSNR